MDRSSGLEIGLSVVLLSFPVVEQHDGTHKVIIFLHRPPESFVYRTSFRGYKTDYAVDTIYACRNIIRSRVMGLWP